MNNGNLWVKTLLVLYRNYKTEIARMDIEMDKLAARGLNHSGDTLSYLEQMRKVVLRKKHCQYAKELVEKYAFNRQLDKCVLYWRYARGRQFNEISQRMERPIRQLFRDHDREVEKFAIRLRAQGITEDILSHEFGSDVLFNMAHSKASVRNVSYCKQMGYKSHSTPLARQYGENGYTS